MLLLVEVADSSLAYDRGPKLALYARHGVPEVWLVDLGLKHVSDDGLPQRECCRQPANPGRLTGWSGHGSWCTSRATVLRCHVAAFEALGGAPRELLYDRMKTAVLGEHDPGGMVYNRALIDLARHYGFHPKACQPYRAKTKGKVELAVPLHPAGTSRPCLPQSGGP